MINSGAETVQLLFCNAFLTKIVSQFLTTMNRRVLSFLVTLWSLYSVFGIELTFELYDNAKDCFYEVIEKNTSLVVEYQVIKFNVGLQDIFNLLLSKKIILNYCFFKVVTGGQYDVDVVIEGPNGETLYQQYKSQYDSTRFVTQSSGVYAVCFSNEFSTFSHKIVYMDLQVGEEKPLAKSGEHITVMTLVCIYIYFFFFR